MSRTIKGSKRWSWELTDPHGGWLGEGRWWRRRHMKVRRQRLRAELRRDPDSI